MIRSLFIVIAGVLTAQAWAADNKEQKKYYNPEIDMLAYMECVSKSKGPGSDRGLYVGEIYKYDKVEKGGAFNGKTLYACALAEWVYFNPENEILASHFAIRNDWLKEKCGKAEEVVFKEAWEQEKNSSQKFGVRINCKRLAPLLK